METYVVRVYRRDPARPSEIVGLVEEVGMKHTQNFHNIDELNAILTTQGKHQQKDGGTEKTSDRAKV